MKSVRIAAVALAASACLVTGVTSAQAAPVTAHTASADAQQSRSAAIGASALPEVRTFTGSAMGVSQSLAVESAVRFAYTIAQGYGWQASQCYVHSTSVRSVGGGLYSATANLFCQR